MKKHSVWAVLLLNGLMLPAVHASERSSDHARSCFDKTSKLYAFLSVGLIIMGMHVINQESVDQPNDYEVCKRPHRFGCESRIKLVQQEPGVLQPQKIWDCEEPEVIARTRRIKHGCKALIQWNGYEGPVTIPKDAHEPSVYDLDELCHEKPRLNCDRDEVQARGYASFMGWCDSNSIYPQLHEHLHAMASTLLNANCCFESWKVPATKYSNVTMIHHPDKHKALKRKAIERSNRVCALRQPKKGKR